MNNQPLTVIEHIVKEYPSMCKVTIFDQPLIIPKPRPGYTPKRNQSDPSEIALQESLRRTRNTIYDYALANDFTHFVTFTFNPKKVDRYSIESTSATMRYWLNRQKKHSPDFAYLIVPEFHKDKAIHFHALIKNYNGHLKKTGVIQKGKRVYNLTGFTAGFTNAQELDDDQIKAAAYIAKYISKDTISKFNKRRYWPSKNLIKPQIHYDSLDILGLSPYITPDNLTYQSEEHHLSIYQIQTGREFIKRNQAQSIQNLDPSSFRDDTQQASDSLDRPPIQPALPGLFSQLRLLPP